ncbi:hypothetical protein [Ramlibacter sp.]|uniref:hypothetical protein n=1 Tax=Ramlibacter sp. TaxID=1917967 RepID=UPI003D108BE4
MTEYRDARLARALQSADEDASAPPAAVRAAVLEAARKAVAPAAASDMPWWRRWFASPQQRMPWNAAFATLLLASLVTLMWRDEEVPGARPESAMADKAQPRAEAPAPAASQSTVAAAPSATDHAANQLPATKSVESRAKSPPPETPALSPVPPPEAPPSPALPATAVTAPTAQQGMRDEVDRPPASAAPAARSEQLRAAPRAPPAAPSAARAAAVSWTDLRVRAAGREFTLARSAVPRVPELLDRVVRSTSASIPWSEVAATTVLLREGETVVGLLEIAPPLARWTPGSGPSRILQPDSTLLQALQDELLR